MFYTGSRGIRLFTAQLMFRWLVGRVVDGADNSRRFFYISRGIRSPFPSIKESIEVRVVSLETGTYMVVSALFVKCWGL